METLRTATRRVFGVNRHSYALAPRAVRGTVLFLRILMWVCLVVTVVNAVLLQTNTDPNCQSDAAGAIDVSFALFTVLYCLARAHREGRRFIYWLSFATAIAGVLWMFPIGIPVLIALSRPEVRRWYSSEPL